MSQHREITIKISTEGANTSVRNVANETVDILPRIRGGVERRRRQRNEDEDRNDTEAN